MASKRDHSPELVGNPFIKKRNLEWSLELTRSPRDGETDNREVSEAENAIQSRKSDRQVSQLPRAAAVEAGEAEVSDHLAYFSAILAKSILKPYPAGLPHLPISAWQALYDANAGFRNGSHFVVHQHDHPVAGTHYDLRLQINETSSASWAIMYGLPGDPNSRRLMRNATETRVHCLWNHLIETGSVSTGSMMIWDTGTYEVLERRSKHAPAQDPDSQNSSDEEENKWDTQTQQEKLHRAFQTRKIKIRLNGTRLPNNYVLNLRLTRDEDAAGRVKSGRKPRTSRRRGTLKIQAKRPEPMTSSESESEISRKPDDDDCERVDAPAEPDQAGISAMEREIQELEDEQVRKTNAYTGATNTIDSVHQRKWFLSMDREASGFVKRRKGGKIEWERSGEEPIQKGGDTRWSFPFYVKGAEVERSIVTGRQGANVLRDEGVVGFAKRKGWQAVLN
ncbi:hypothetical protein TruAng_001834 [Truncatella angustata]|nr:hypothetical protein TruAng_001834 [Truncatella angustata]